MGDLLEAKQLKSLIGIGKNGLPLKCQPGWNVKDCKLKDGIKKQLRIHEEAVAVNRYIWYNLPEGLSSQQLERFIYYKGQLCFFYDSKLEHFYFLPYALEGGLDFYGRFTGVRPVPLATGGSEKEKMQIARQASYLANVHLTPIYEIPEKITIDHFTKGCVLLRDYTNQMAETVLPRQIVNDPLLDYMSELIPMSRTALILNSGVSAIKVETSDEVDNISRASSEMLKAALSGDPFIPVISNLNTQPLSQSGVLKSEEYLLMFQGLESFQLGTFGLDNGGVFQKKAHMLEAEQEANSSHARIAYQDGLSIRQEFCRLVNAVYGLGISVEASPAAIGMEATANIEYPSADMMQETIESQPTSESIKEENKEE